MSWNEQKADIGMVKRYFINVPGGQKQHKDNFAKK